MIQIIKCNEIKLIYLFRVPVAHESAKIRIIRLPVYKIETKFQFR